MANTPSITKTLILSVALWLVIGLASGGLLLFSQFERYALDALDGRLIDEIQDLKRDAILVEPDTVEFQTPFRGLKYQRIFSGWYWQLAGVKGNIDSSRSLFDGPLEIDWSQASVDGSFQATPGPRGQNLRVLTTYSDFEAGRLYFAVAANRERVDNLLSTVRRFLWMILPAIGLFLLLTITIQMRIGLRPLRRISRELRAVRDGKRGELASDYPIELGPLAEEINQLQHANASLVERARRHVGNLAHALKTPLAVINNEAAGAEPILTEQVTEMRGHIDRYLALARNAAVAQTRGLRTPISEAITPLANTIEKINRSKGIWVQCDIDDDLVFLGDKIALTEALGNVIDNAAKWGQTSVRVSAAALPARQVEIRVEDDGPGIPPSDRARALARGQRLDERTPGTGLGLSIVVDIVDAYGGSITLDESEPLGGLAVVLVLPGLAKGARIR